MRAGIDAQSFAVIVNVHGRHRLTLADVYANHIGDVVFALYIVMGEKIDVFCKATAAETIHADVAFRLVYTLFRRGIFVLDNAAYTTV